MPTPPTPPVDMKGKFFVFYDGVCPVCSREIAWLQKKAKGKSLKRKIHWVDIAQPNFEAQSYGKSLEDFMRSLHVFDGERYFTAMDSIRCLYRELGLGRWMNWTKIPVVKSVVDMGYAVFAKYRPRFSRFSVDGETCSEVCAEKSQKEKQKIA